MKNLKLKAVITAVALSGTLIAGSTMSWFTDQTPVAPTTFTAGTVKIAADRTLTGPGDNLYYTTAEYSVAKFSQGTVDHPERKVTAGDNLDVYNRIGTRWTGNGQPKESDKAFYSMSQNGWLMIGLSSPLNLGSGIRVIECTGNLGSSTGLPEYADVYVGSSNEGFDVNSFNGSTGGFVKVGQVNNVDGVPRGSSMYDTQLVIDDSSVNFPIKYILLKDVSKHPSGTPVSYTGDGFDIDYLSVALMNEGNWNPGDVNYIAYRVDNIGTKDINVRAKVNGAWSDGLPVGNVTITLSGDSTNWMQTGSNEFVYIGSSGKNILAGSKPEFDSNPTSAYLYLMVTVSGAGTGNAYQHETYTLTPTFEAIQASHSGDTLNTSKPNYESGGWTWGTTDLVTGGTNS